MLEAKCPKCGYHGCGWALTEPEHQTCPKCGTRLEIHEENRTTKESNQTDNTRQAPKVC